MNNYYLLLSIVQQVPVDCAIQEILYPSLDKQLSWDDRKTYAKWDEVMNEFSKDFQSSKDAIFKKITEPVAEPFCEVISGSSSYIQILLSAIATYSEYKCDIQCINFKDTLMFQVNTNF